MNKTFKIYLEGPFQASGAPSAGNVHNISSMPTKRGIAGLLGCCLGLPRGDKKLEEIYAGITIKVKMVNRGKYPKRIRDFQVVSSLNGEAFPTADGGTKPKNLIKTKFYMSDAAYEVKIMAEEKLAQELFEAVKDPYWVPYLGRKCCMPSTKIEPKWVKEVETCG